MMQRGTVKRLVLDRGFGFIADERGNEFFFHRTDIARGIFENLREGARVTFEARAREEPSPKGPHAASVRVV
jgi:CspA family cold shock protein